MLRGSTNSGEKTAADFCSDAFADRDRFAEVGVAAI
jgi:hypothetical protein